jgi:hypothetical protein
MTEIEKKRKVVAMPAMETKIVLQIRYISCRIKYTTVLRINEALTASVCCAYVM